MAGRSGAAAMEVALREVAASFDASKLGAQLVSSDPAVAAALIAIKHKPFIEMREGECYLEYSSAPEGGVVRRKDVTPVSGAAGHGVELLLVGDEPCTLIGVSLFVE